MNPTNSELKACPFCGGKGYIMNNDHGLWQGECYSCRAATDGYNAQAKAIAAWNTRKSEALADDAVAQVLAHVADGGPHEWGYRDPVTGDFIADDWPFKAADALAALSPHRHPRRRGVAERGAEPCFVTGDV